MVACAEVVAHAPTSRSCSGLLLHVGCHNQCRRPHCRTPKLHKCSAGLWFVAAVPATLLRLCRTEESEPEPRSMGISPGRCAPTVTPRRSRRGSPSTHKARSGDGALSALWEDGCLRPPAFCFGGGGWLCGRWIGCREAPQGLSCIFSFFRGLFAFELGYLYLLKFSRGYCVCGM